MTTLSIEERLTAIEKELAQIKQQLAEDKSQTPPPWWEQRFGVFKDDPLFEEAVRLGREWRDAQNALSEEQ